MSSRELQTLVSPQSVEVQDTASPPRYLEVEEQVDHQQLASRLEHWHHQSLWLDQAWKPSLVDSAMELLSLELLELNYDQVIAAAVVMMIAVMVVRAL